MNPPDIIQSHVQVLITMHISSACASCPYIGKAYGFDLADKAAPVIHSPGCAPPCSSDCSNPGCADADAVLLVLEAYTVDLSSHIQLHKQHAPECSEFPCSRCLHRPRQAVACKTLTVRAASAATAQLQALAAPINAATATACMFASAVTSGAQPKDKARSAHSTAGEAQLDSPHGQVVSLWEYATRLRESGLVMSVWELLRIALELAEAVHALHTVAHVRICFPRCIHAVVATDCLPFRTWSSMRACTSFYCSRQSAHSHRHHSSVSFTNLKRWEQRKTLYPQVRHIQSCLVHATKQSEYMYHVIFACR